MSGVRIGIDLGGTKIEAIALGAGGQVLLRRRIPTPPGDYARTVEAIAGAVEGFERELGRRAAVGIGTPGALSPATGLLKNANRAWLNGRPLAADLERRLARRLRFANDADCFALSEARDGAAAGARVVFGVIVGTGTGGGLVVDGRIWTGPNAIAGEWGHNPLPWPEPDEWPGPPCWCGKTGCVETFLSGPGLARDYRPGASSRPAAPGNRPEDADRPDTAGDGVDAVEIAARASRGEPAAEAALARYQGRMARALAGVINLLDPDVIVLGGGLSNFQRLYAHVPRLLGAGCSRTPSPPGSCRRPTATPAECAAPPGSGGLTRADRERRRRPADRRTIMLTRQGSPPGPACLRRLSQAMASVAADPEAAARRRRFMAWFWVVWVVMMLLGLSSQWALSRAARHPYRSAIEVAGLPLFAYGEQARGIVAVGGVAVGAVAVGGIAVGGIAFGGVAAGGVAIGGVSAGLLALAGLALGWCALGGGALGYYALGGLAVGGYAYAGGGVALGYHEASGAQKERLLG